MRQAPLGLVGKEGAPLVLLESRARSHPDPPQRIHERGQHLPGRGALAGVHGPERLAVPQQHTPAIRAHPEPAIGCAGQRPYRHHRRPAGGDRPVRARPARGVQAHVGDPLPRAGPHPAVAVLHEIERGPRSQGRSNRGIDRLATGDPELAPPTDPHPAAHVLEQRVLASRRARHRMEGGAVAHEGAVHGRHPDPFRPVHQHLPHFGPGDRRLRDAAQRVGLQHGEAPGGGDPQPPLAVEIEAVDPLRGKVGVLGLHRGEGEAIVPHQAATGAEPEVAVRRLRHGVHLGLRQPLVLTDNPPEPGGLVRPLRPRRRGGTRQQDGQERPAQLRRDAAKLGHGTGGDGGHGVSIDPWTGRLERGGALRRLGQHPEQALRERGAEDGDVALTCPRVVDPCEADGRHGGERRDQRRGARPVAVDPRRGEVE